MPSLKIALDSKDLEIFIKHLEATNKNVKKSCESALRSSKQYVTNQLEKDTVKANFPAQGTYSHGGLKESIDKNYKIEWQGDKAFIKIGYNFRKSGLLSIFMMYGAPRKSPPMRKARKLYADVYGEKTREKVKDIQEETLLKILKRG